MSRELTRSQRKRAAIERAAIAEFSARGFRDTSMDRIAERAEVSKRTVYNHFPSKDDLFRVITVELLEHTRRIDVPYDAKRPLAEQLTAIARQEVEAISSDAFMGIARAMLAEAFRDPEGIQRLFPNLDEGDDGITAWIRAAAEDGRLRVDDVSLASEQFTALIKGSLFWPQAIGLAPPPDEAEAERVIDAAVGMFLDHYARPSKAR